MTTLFPRWGRVLLLLALPYLAQAQTGSACFTPRTRVAVGAAHVADLRNRTSRNIAAAGAVSTLAGTAGNEGSADGRGAAARFNYPFGVAVDRAGAVYVADMGNQTIRKITAAGAVSTLAGTAGHKGNANGTGAAARFNNPTGVAVNAAGAVYVADQHNQTIRVIK